MIGCSRRLAVVLALAGLLAVGLHHAGAYDDPIGGHDIDLGVVGVTPYESGGFQVDDSEANRLDFLEVGTNFDVDVRIQVRNETGTGETLDEVSLHLGAVHQAAGNAVIDGQDCWNWDRNESSAFPPPPDAPVWNITYTGSITVDHAQGEGPVDLVASVNNDNTSSPECAFEEWSDEEDSTFGDGPENNDAEHTVNAGPTPDLTTTPEPVEWCWRDGEEPAGANATDGGACNTDVQVNASNPDTVHPYPASATNRTYFQVNVTNVGNWTQTALADSDDWDSSDWPPGEGSPNDAGEVYGIADPNQTDTPLEYEVDITVRHLPSGDTWDLSRDDDADSFNADVPYTGNVSSLLWDLSDKPAGDYRVTFRIDLPQDRVEELDESDVDNTRRYKFTLFSADLEPEINTTDLQTTPENAYEYDGTQNITINTSLRNVGARNASTPWSWDAVLHPGDDDREREVDHGVLDFLDAGNASYPSFNITYCIPEEDVDKPCELAPGEHTLRLQVDTDGNVTEELETNNVDTVTFYTEDAQAPVIENLTRDPPDDPARTGQNVTFAAEITEKDPNFDNVTLHLDRPGNLSTLTFDMEAKEGAPTFNFTHKVFDLEGEGTYEWWVTGADPSGNTFGNSDTPETFSVSEWPKNVEVHSPLNGTKYDWHADSVLAVEYEVTINETGWEPEWSTTGKLINITTPGGFKDVRDVKSDWTDSEGCPPDGDNQSEETEDCDKDLFYNSSAVIPEETEPGRYNVTFAVRDKAGVWKEVETWYDVQDTPPHVDEENVTIDGPDTTVDDSEETVAVPSESFFNFTVNATDPDGFLYLDDGEVGVTTATVNFTHVNSGRSANRTLSLVEGNKTESTWTGTITTGSGGDLPWSGLYNYTIAPRDDPGNWNETHSDDVTAYEVRITDGRQPVIEESGVDPEREETDVPVRFFATVDDDTALDVEVSITPPDGSTLCDTDQESCSFDLEGKGSEGLFERRLSFGTAGDYEWEIIATDSAGNSDTTPVGVLEIRENIPPTVDVVEPSAEAPENATYYTDTRPTLIASIQDPKDVQQDSISLAVDGKAVNESDYELQRIPERQNQKPGYNLSYAFLNQYSDGDEIQVRVSATDASNQERSRTALFTFRVDGTTPDTTLDEFKPRFRLGGAFWNVSTHTEFTLDADDPGQVQSGVEGSRFKIDAVTGVAQGPVRPYDGPFKINATTFGSTVTQGKYDVTYWSVDRAGNQESQKTIRVNVDRHGPDFGFYEPKGRFINISISDAQGVAGATVHYEDPESDGWKTREMTFSEGLYRGVLPGDLAEGEKIDYYMTARDQIGNRNNSGSPENPFTYEVGNRVPTVSWVTPADGASLSGDTTFRWDGSDADADDTPTYTLLFKLATEDEESYRQLTPVTGESVTYDTSQRPDGTYDIRVVAADENLASSDVIRVTFDNAQEAAVPNELPDSEFTVGEPVTFTSEVKQAAERVELVVTRDGEELDPIPMRDDGQGPDAEAGDAIYTVERTFNESGTYSWKVQVTWEEDGQTVTEESEAGQTFSVQNTASRVFSENIGLWVAVIVLTAAAVGLGAYGLRNHQQGP